MAAKSKMADIFASEKLQQRRTHLVQARFDDVWGTTHLAGSNNEFSLSTTHYYLRLRSRRCLDFSTGFVSLTTPRRVEGSTKSYDGVALLPICNFVDAFENSAGFAAALEAAADDLVVLWNKENVDPKRAKRRTATGKSFTLFEHSFTGRNSRTERSVYELQLNTYGYTQTNMQAARILPITKEEIRVVLKLKSTVGSGHFGDKSGVEDGLSYDKYGYSAPFPHFKNLLLSVAFKRFVQSTASILRMRTEEVENELKTRKASASLNDMGLGPNDAEEEEVEEEEEDAEEDLASVHSSTSTGSDLQHPALKTEKHLVVPARKRLKQQPTAGSTGEPCKPRQPKKVRGLRQGGEQEDETTTMTMRDAMKAADVASYTKFENQEKKQQDTDGKHWEV